MSFRELLKLIGHPGRESGVGPLPAKRSIALLVGAITLLSTQAQAMDLSGPAPAAPHEVQKPLQVFGQSRNLSMQLTLRSQKDKFKLFHVRTDYHDKFAKVRY